MSARAAQLRITLLGFVLLLAIVVAWALFATDAPVSSLAALSLEATPELRVEVPAVIEVAPAERDPSEVPRTGESEAPEAPAASATEAVSKRKVALDGIEGEVRDVNGFALGDARVTLRVRRGEFGLEVAATRTDRMGRYSIGLNNWPSPAELERRLYESMQRRKEKRYELEEIGYVASNETYAIRPRPRDDLTGVNAARRALDAPLELTVTASFRGHEPRTERREVGTVVTGRMRIDFELEPGNAVQGRVTRERAAYGRGGGLVAGAQVFLLDELGAIAKRARTDYEGKYVIFVPQPGVYDAFARHPAYGTALLERVEVNPQAAPWLPDLALRGDGHLRGQVVFPDDKTVEGLPLHLEHELVREFGNAMSDEQRIGLEWGVGLVVADTVTDSKGEFEFSGLHPGTFELSFPSEPDPSLAPPFEVATGDERLRIIFRGYRLRIWVQQKDASPADVAQIECVELRGDERGPKLIGEWSGKGQWLTSVEPGASYLVRAWASNLQADWTIVRIEPASYETYASLALLGTYAGSPSGDQATGERAGHGGRVVIEVRDDHDAKLGGWLARAVASDGTTPRGWSNARPDEKGELPALPPGTYKVTLRTEGSESYLTLPAEPLVLTVAQDALPRATVRASIGGRVLLSATQDDESRAARLATRDDEPSNFGVRATAELHGPGESRPIELTPRATASNSNDVEGRWLRAGARAICDPVLAPGRYTVRVYDSGGSRTTFTIQIAAEKTTEVTVTPKAPLEDE